MIPNSVIKTRFAPSPTGLMHLGNVRTALFSALFAYKNGGIFVLRIEDTDVERSSSHFEQAILADLKWLGLQWQEGPEVGGPHGPYQQQLRQSIYASSYLKLEQRGQVYPCFCSEQQLKFSRKLQLTAGKPPRYEGTCVHLSQRDVEVRLNQGIQPTLRFRVPREEVVVFHDLVRGEQRFPAEHIGDFIIRRANGSPSFFFSNAIDDALMGISHVLRGEDHLTNTPRQLLLLLALDLPIPHYGHIALITGADGTPLSKRNGSKSIEELRQAGYFPAAINNYLVRLGHHYEGGQGLTLNQMVEIFELQNLAKSPARYDEAQLNHWQKESVAQADMERLWQWLPAEVRQQVPPAQQHPFIAVIRHNLSFPADACWWAQVLYADNVVWQPSALAIIQQTDKRFFETALNYLAVLPAAAVLSLAPLVNEFKSQLDLKGKALFQPLRAVLTGDIDGPELGQFLPLLSIHQARRRFDAALHWE